MENNQTMESGYNDQAPVANQSTESNSPSRPKISGLETLLKSSINEWRNNLRKFIEIYLWGVYYSLIPLAIVFLSIFISLSFDHTLIRLITVIALVLSIFTIVYFFTQAYSGMFIFLKKNFQGSAKESFKEARPFIWLFIWLSVLTSILVILWSLLLIIPGIIFSIYYSLAVYVFFFEGKKGMEAIKRSKALVKGYWWPVFGRTIGFSLIVWLFMILVSIPNMIAVENSWFWHLWNVVVQVISYLIGPIAIIFSYKIYRDLVNMKK
jgi:hypothetical protein